MKRLMKKFIVILLSLMILASLLIPVLAYEETNGVTRVGLGYDTQTIYINGNPYSATFYLAGNVTTGGYSVFDTQARSIRYHQTVTVIFFTQGTGQETYSGGSKTSLGEYDSSLLRYVGHEKVSQSNFVKYGGTNTATGIKKISATGRLTTVNQNGTSQSYSFSASAG